MQKKHFYFLALAILLSSAASAQKFRAVDKSPMDMAYYPDHFAHDRKAGDKAIVRVIYSRPQKNGRAIFGTTVPYQKVWRTGANEASEIKFYQDVEVAGKQVKAGTYSLFTIPGEKEWTIILNSDLDFWGAYQYQERNDVIRVTAPATKADNMVENFAIQFEKKEANSGVMKLGWDNTVVEVPFKF
ncbi:MAG: DUF2911 domain-containing protein [Chitinophagaceae bacterium]